MILNSRAREKLKNGERPYAKTNFFYSFSATLRLAAVPVNPPLRYAAVFLDNKKPRLLNHLATAGFFDVLRICELEVEQHVRVRRNRPEPRRHQRFQRVNVFAQRGLRGKHFLVAERFRAFGGAGDFMRRMRRRFPAPFPISWSRIRARW